MTIGEKLKALRRQKNISQEQLAEICGVSRQSVSKWEMHTALPQADKLLTLSAYFAVPLDVLMRDEMQLSAVREVHTCAQNGPKPVTEAVYTGILIKESLADEDLLDAVCVRRVELWRTGGRPRYWTALIFTAGADDFPVRLSRALWPAGAGRGRWFADMKADGDKLIVFPGEVLRYRIGNAAQRAAVCARARALGIPDEQMQWEE